MLLVTFLTRDLAATVTWKGPCKGQKVCLHLPPESALPLALFESKLPLGCNGGMLLPGQPFILLLLRGTLSP